MLRLKTSAGFLLLLLAWLSSPSGAAPAADPYKIDLWLKRPGGAQQEGAKGNLMTFDMRGLIFDELDTYDIQYERMVRVRGMHLRNLIAVFKPIPENVDLLLLHTRSGMIVPVSIARLRSDIEVFVAVEMKVDGAWTSAFPESVHARGDDSNEVKVTFAGNKVIVGKDWRATETGFTPWRLLDTLTGIEFVESGAYYDQFRSASTPEATSRGRVAYMVHCQYCHGIKGLGAQRGPNLTNVMEALGKDAARKIHDQVQAPGADGKFRHFMPRQRDFTKTEAEDLIQWLDSLREGSLTPYEPTYKSTVK